MEKYLIPLVPGPVAVPQEILKVAATNFGSADFEPEYLALYKDTEKLLQKMMETCNRVVIQTGEGVVDGLEKYVKTGRSGAGAFYRVVRRGIRRYGQGVGLRDSGAGFWL